MSQQSISVASTNDADAQSDQGVDETLAAYLKTVVLGAVLR